MNDLLKELNFSQRKAVEHDKGPLLIIAGAGTGKTKVITHRIAHLITSKRARPDEILAVTFTEKAANEMEERVDRLIPYSYSFVEISTFNSFGERVLRNYGHELGYPPDFRLLNDVEQAIFFREKLFRFPLQYYRPLSSPTRYIQELLSVIKRLKQEDIEPGEYSRQAKKQLRQAEDSGEKESAEKHLEIAEVYRRYQSLLEEEGKIDFEDQVNLVVRLLRERPSILKEIQGKYKYILVDEFQDTNYIQFELLKLLAQQHKNLTVVGDDDQSIFRFRGASLSNIRSFSNIYPDRKKIVLNENYRSTQPILDAAYIMIQNNNPDRLEVQENIDKKLHSNISATGKSINLLQFDKVSHEADRIAEMILEKKNEKNLFNDFAILVRRNADADPYLRALNKENIPVRFSGSRGLYYQQEIKILIAFIRCITDFEDSSSLFFLSLSEIYGFDLYDLSLISIYARKKHFPLHKVFKMIYEDQSPVEISSASREKVKKIFQDLLYYVHLSSSQNAGRVLYSFLERSGYLKSLVKKGGIQAELNIKNIRIFFDKVKNFSEVGKSDSIQSFAEHLDLLQQVDDNPPSAEAELEEDAVNVLTVHKAKGLEFPFVFMVSLIADRFPGRLRREKIPVPDELLKEDLPEGGNYIHEERRLFYVGMTRARKSLYLTWARDYGLKRLKKVSPFVLEALNLSSTPDKVHRTSALEEIQRYAPQPGSPEVHALVKEQKILTLSYFQVENYLTCPLKYRYSIISKIPTQTNHNLVFGRTLHNTIHVYLKMRMSGKKFSEGDVLQEYEKRWINEGFLSREHEEMRKKAGEKALRHFYRREEASDQVPSYLEKNFKWQEGGLRFTGRWDRVDITEKGAVIIDFKATEIKNKKEADKRTNSSLQMDLYALSFMKTQDQPLSEVRLHFLESDLLGCAQKGSDEFEKAKEKILEVEQGVRSQMFDAKPDWHNCSHCDYRAICPDSYAY
jgi:DNA helicase-2/ATP-dependent DNA helicase PcrA